MSLSNARAGTEILGARGKDQTRTREQALRILKGAEKIAEKIGFRELKDQKEVSWSRARIARCLNAGL